MAELLDPMRLGHLLDPVRARPVRVCEAESVMLVTAVERDLVASARSFVDSPLCCQIRLAVLAVAVETAT